MSFYRCENRARVYGPTGRHLGSITDRRVTIWDGTERATWDAFAGGNMLPTRGDAKADAVAAVLDNAARCGVAPRELAPVTVEYFDPASWRNVGPAA